MTYADSMAYRALLMACACPVAAEEYVNDWNMPVG